MFLNMYFVLLTSLFVCVQGQYYDTTLRPIDQYHAVCIKESNVSACDVESLKKGNYRKSSPELKKWVFCYLMKTGVMSSAGVLRQHVVLKNIPEAEKDAVESTINKCLVHKAHDPVETAWHYLFCFHANHPQFVKDANGV